MKWVIDDINPAFDAIDENNKKVQIKTRRYKGSRTAMTGNSLDKDFNVSFDYAVLVLLNVDYSLKDIIKIDACDVTEHFTRINNQRDWE